MRKLCEGDSNMPTAKDVQTLLPCDALLPSWTLATQNPNKHPKQCTSYPGCTNRTSVTACLCLLPQLEAEDQSQTQLLSQLGVW